MRIFNHQPLIQTGYVAGTGDGIVTIDGKGAARMVYALNQTMQVAAKTISTKTGQYLLTNLDPTQTYLILCKDHTGVYDPVCYDHIFPMHDKTLDEIVAMWESMYGR